MPAKKEATGKEKKVKTEVQKEKPVKATPVKKPAKKPAAAKKESAPKKTAAPAVAKTIVVKEKGRPSTLSKQKQRKLKIEDKFHGKRYHLGVGKRKSAVALVRLHEKGSGTVFINNKDVKTYFFGVLIEDALQALILTGKEEAFDITAKVEGGGVSAQAEAVRHGIARALVEYDISLRIVLKKAGLLTRDARTKERKKPGLKRARRAPQWRKR